MPLEAQDVQFLLDSCRVKLPGATDANIKHELFSTVKEFLNDSDAWLETINLLVTAGTQEYALTPKSGGQIISLMAVLDGLRLPVKAAMPEFGTLTVYQAVNVTSVAQAPTDLSRTATTPWIVQVVKNVKLPTTKDQVPIVPDFVLSVYSEYIKDGVLGRMMTEQAKPYTNLQMGAMHLKRYRDGIGIARTKSWSQNLVGGQRWAFPQNFATRSQRSGVSTSWPGVW